MIRNRTHQAVTSSRVILTVALLGLFTASASAGPVVVTFSGHLTETLAPGHIAALGYDPSIAVGAPFSGTFAYDPDTAVDEYPANPRYGDYTIGTNMIGEVGMVQFEVSNLVVLVYNDHTIGTGGPLDNFVAGGTNGELGEKPLVIAALRLGGHAGIFDSDALPTILELSEFSEANYVDFAIPDPLEDTIVIARGVLASMVLIPEPTTLALLVFMCLGSFAVRMRA